MKFILMMGMKTDQENMSKGIMTWPKDDIQAHIGFMIGFSKELKEAGELVSAEGLAGQIKPSWYEPATMALQLPMVSSQSRRSF